MAPTADIGDVDFLATQAVGAGLFPSEEDAKSWLASDEKKEVSITGNTTH